VNRRAASDSGPPGSFNNPTFARRGSPSSTWQRDCWTKLELHVVPVVLGDGARLFDNLGDAAVQLEQVRAVEAPGVTRLKHGSVK
jgi:hypothetical protein